MTSIPIRRLAFFVFSAVVACEAVGALVLAITLSEARLFALASISIGLAVGCLLWWFTRAFGGASWRVLGLRLSVVGTAALAVHALLSQSLWALGVLIDIGSVEAGHMAEHAWLGPATLAYSACCYALMRWEWEKAKPRDLE